MPQPRSLQRAFPVGLLVGEDSSARRHERQEAVEPGLFEKLSAAIGVPALGVAGVEADDAVGFAQ
jgi:hypothetical protein